MLLAQEEGLLSALLGDGYDDTVHERFLVALKDMMLVEEVRTGSGLVYGYLALSVENRICICIR